jgi:hypothetical protein
VTSPKSPCNIFSLSLSLTHTHTHNTHTHTPPGWIHPLNAELPLSETHYFCPQTISQSHCFLSHNTYGIATWTNAARVERWVDLKGWWVSRGWV